MPREGHLDHVIYIFLFSYSKACHNLRIVLDLTYPDIVNMNDFKHYICKQFYGNGKELMPSNTPRLIEEEFIIQAFVDADFAGDNLTRRSRSSFLVMLNNIALLSFSKKQSSMETSSFGRKFVVEEDIGCLPLSCFSAKAANFMRVRDFQGLKPRL